MCPSDTTSLPLSSSERKRTSSIRRARVLDLGLRLLDQLRDVRAGQVGRVEEREDPGERCSQLVRDRGREAGAELVEAAVIHQIVTIPKPGQNPPPVYRRRVAKILIVEDDNVIADGMAKHLMAAGFDPIVVGRGELGLARLRFENPDVCVLDLMLPELDGWKLIETARAEGIGTPIVVVSARGTEHDRVHALEIGADDYLVKPFSMRELVARVGAAARRGVRPQEERRGEAIEIEELRIDPREVQAFVDGKSADLTPTEFKLLYTLALDRGRVVTRDELLQKVWGRRETHRDRTVDVFVRRLRQKIDRNASAALVHPDALRRRLQARARAEELGQLARRRELADSLPAVDGFTSLRRGGGHSTGGHSALHGPVEASGAHAASASRSPAPPGGSDGRSVAWTST